MKETVPIFIVGSGRSGTRMIYKLLSGLSHIEIYHEYLCTHIQPLAAKYFMGFMSKSEVKKEFMKLHGSAIFYSTCKYWVDSSNKLSWIIEPIFDLYPNARFIHVVRDGRKVVSSFYHKLSPEIYDDVSVSIMQEWILHPRKNPVPPPEKKYWWNIPQKKQPYYEEFPTFNQFQRICYQWDQSIKTVTRSLKRIPDKQKMIVKLEDLVSKKSVLKKFLNFFDVPYDEKYFEFMQTPQNVFVPMDFSLTNRELSQFYSICGETMKDLGYSSSKTYNVIY